MSFFPFAIFGDNYDSLWDKVKEAQRKDLPRQVVDHAQKIYDKAAHEHNFPQLTKAWITLIETKADIDPDSFNLAKIEPLECHGPVEQALYDAIMATAYQTMRDSHISDFDVDTWVNYNDEAERRYDHLLDNMEALANESSDKYLPLIKEGTDSRIYNHDLLSLLTRFIIDHSKRTRSQKGEIAQRVAAFYKEHGNLNAYTLLTLQQLQLQSGAEDYNLRLSDHGYTDALKALVDESKDIDAGADVARVYAERLYGDEKLIFARWAQQQFPRAYNRNYFSDIEKEQMHSQLAVSFSDNLLAGRPFGISLRYDNLTSASVEVRRYNGVDKNNRPMLDGKLVEHRDYTLGQDSAAVSRRAQRLPFDGVENDTLQYPAGHYVVIAKSPDAQAVEELKITSLRLFLFSQPDHQILAYVADNETGRPVPGAMIELFDRDDKVTHIQCDKQGEARFAEKGYNYASAMLEDTDDRTPKTRVSAYYSEYGEYVSDDLRLYTDRAIYRPGQEVHVAGFFVHQSGDNTEVNTDARFTLSFRDANFKEIASQHVTTNQHGTFDATFTIPKDRLPGVYQLRAEGASVSIRVEEYKRPTFTVEAKAAAESAGRDFSFGDTIQVEAVAKTFAGVPVQGAKVKYQIETSEVDFWRWWNTDWDALSNAEAETDDLGRVVIPLFLDPKKLSEYSDKLVRFRVTFTITDQAGETQEDSYSLSLSRRGFGLSIELPQVVNYAERKHFIVRARNANNEEVPVDGQYRLYLTGRQYSGDKPMAEGAFSSGQSVQLPQGLKPGSYTLITTATDQHGNEIEQSASFTLFDAREAVELSSGRLSSGEPSVDATLFTDDFFYVLHSTFSEQQPADFIFSPKEGDVMLGYQITANDKVLTHRRLAVGRRLYRLTIPYKASYGHGVSVIIYYVRNGHLCQRHLEFTYERPDKRLILSWSTFRDRLYPGQEEQWILNIHDPEGRPVEGAELMATLYDASLDQLESHAWNFGLYFRRSVIDYPLLTTAHNSGIWLRADEYFRRAGYDSRHYDELTEFVHQRWARETYRFRDFGGGSSRVLYDAAPMAMSSMAVEEEVVNFSMSEPRMKEAMIETDADVIAQEQQPQEHAAPQLRTNLYETAFFLPHLLSDDKGDVHISFTLPESLTEWHFLGLAHDDAVRYGQITASAVARKDFMVQPNVPRFVRDGDHATLTTRIINQCDHDVQGTAQLRLLDAESEKVVQVIPVPFEVKAGQTTSVSFLFEPTDAYPMLICEVTAQSGNISDGERHFLPVLSSSRFLTEAVPFYVTAEESEKHIDLSELFNQGSPTATHRRLLFEFTARPEWTVIEALDAIKLPDHDNAPCFSAALYANALASALAKSILGFHKALLRARELGIEAESQLDYNQELLDIVQLESPWVREALYEAQQRNRLIDLFDEANIQQRTLKAVERLQKLQTASGAWSWFEGMEPSYYITLSVCDDLSLLLASPYFAQTGLDREQLQQMYLKGMKYLDSEELKDYEHRLKHKYGITLSNSTIHYLDVWARQPQRQVSKSVTKMRDAYLKQLEREVRDLTIQGRAMGSIILRAFNRQKTAGEFLQSLVEYTVTKPGMGRYYATDIAYYSWRDYRLPTHVAAMQAIALSDRPDRQQLLRDMQIWLLRQKQSQSWDSPMNTIAAVSLLLQISGNQLAQGGTMPRRFALDTKPLDIQPDSTRFLSEQLGYARTDLTSQLDAPAVHDLHVTSAVSADSLPQISWGAVYAQYMERLDHVQTHGTAELKVSHRLLNADGKPLNDAESGGLTTLKVGDEVIVRLSITADRDMDFVQLRSQHPACFEPVNQRSGYQWMGGRGGYIARHDASTDIFFDRFTKGTTTYDLHFRVDRTGEYLSGVTTAQCAYAPEFVAHTAAYRITVE